MVIQKLRKWWSDTERSSDRRLGQEDVQERIRRGKALLADAARPAFELQPLIETPVPSEAVSSIGGRPSLPPGDGWPVDPKGRPMLFLAQVRFEEQPVLPNFPDKGLMSFFVGSGSLYGQSWRAKSPSVFSVRYFEDALGLERAEPPKKPAGSDMFGKRLRAEGAPLQARAIDLCPNYPTLEFGRILDELGPRLQGDDEPDGFTAEELEALVDAALIDEAEENGSSPIYFGGHPRFCQTEVRSPDDSPAMTEVLLQMGYFAEAGQHWQIQWGDSGEATFLATKDDLADRRFDRVLYHWECH